jgi:hypothetical protein
MEDQLSKEIARAFLSGLMLAESDQAMRDDRAENRCVVRAAAFEAMFIPARHGAPPFCEVVQAAGRASYLYLRERLITRKSDDPVAPEPAATTGMEVEY